mgnify:FL=1
MRSFNLGRFLWSLEVYTLALLAGCAPRKASLPPDWEALRKALPIQEAHAYTLNWAGADGARGYIKADTLRQATRQDTLWWILKGHVEAEWSASDQKGVNRLRCEEAHLLPQTGLLKMYRAIHVTTAAGETLETDELWWDRSTGRLWAPGWIRLQTPREEIRGWGLESTNNLRSYKLRRIQGRIQNPAL